MRKRALWLCVLLMGVMWVFGEGHAEKPKSRGESQEGASGKQSASLVLLLKQLNEKLERLTQKMSRIEGRLVVLEANQHKQVAEMERRYVGLKAELQKAAAEQAERTRKQEEEAERRYVSLKKEAEEAKKAGSLRKAELERAGQRRWGDFYVWAGRREEKRSEKEAALWYKAACGVGNQEGCKREWEVGWRWAKKVEQKAEKWGEVDKWGKEACEKGFVKGCIWLKETWFKRGEGLRLGDWEKAKVWYKAACEGGYKGACGQEKKRITGERFAVRIGTVEAGVRWIPAGEFVMGSPEGEPNRSSNEGPQRTVRISEGFWMMESEVTQGQWKEVMGTNPSNRSDCDKCPVEKVKWHQAAAYANKLSEKGGLEKCFVCNGKGDGVECEGVGNKGSDYVRCKGWRLPTEAEWEYAGRAGTKTAYHTGDCISAAQANYDGNYPQTNCEKGKYQQQTIEVCSLARNAWGLCDMHGNVWEWVYDGHEGTAYQKLGAVDPVYVAAATSNRVLRGGSWYDDARYLRAAYRGRFAPTDAGHNLGFSVAQALRFGVLPFQGLGNCGRKQRRCLRRESEAKAE